MKKKAKTEYIALFVYRVQGTKYFWQVGCTGDDSLNTLMAHYNANKGLCWEFISLTIEEA